MSHEKQGGDSRGTGGGGFDAGRDLPARRDAGEVGSSGEGAGRDAFKVAHCGAGELGEAGAGVDASGQAVKDESLERLIAPFMVDDPSVAADVGRLLCAVAYGATLTIEPRPLLCSGGGWLAKLESQTGARYAEAEADNLGEAIAVLAEKWART